MAPDPATVDTGQGARFLLLYALAFAGGFVAYVPLLTILLPVKMAVIAADARIEWLSAATLLGAISASLANVGFGWASDVTRSRQPWIAAGLVLTVVGYAAIHVAGSPGQIVAAVVAWQFALNMMLSPLSAFAADHVPDRQKGLLGGLLGAGPPVGALASVLVTLPGAGGEAVQFASICTMVVALIVPLLLIGRPRALLVVTRPMRDAAAVRLRRVDLTLMWVARLLVQIAGSVMFGYLLYYFQSLPGGAITPTGVARIGGATLVAALPLAVVLGRASDRLRARRPFLIGTALAMTAGLAMMATVPAPDVAVGAYALFGCACAIFLALHSAYAMQMLPSPHHRGRDLGLFNLTNTLPSILSPILAVALVPGHGFGRLLGTLAALTALAAGLVALVRSDCPAADA